MTTLTDLIERLEKSKGGSRELDGHIAYEALGVSYCIWEDGRCELLERDSTVSRGICPAYTTSLDAALTLVIRDTAWSVSHDPGMAPAVAKIGIPYKPVIMATAATPALALSAAALKARAS